MTTQPDELAALLRGLSDEDVADLVDSLPEAAVLSMLGITPKSDRSLSPTPLDLVLSTDPAYRRRDHLTYLSDRLAAAVHDVERGRSRFLRVSMPPRMGKSVLTSVWFPTWVLTHHPDWKIGLLSHSPGLAASWGRQVRRLVEEHGSEWGLGIAHDAGAVTDWETTDRGEVHSRSVGQPTAGLGFKVLLLDDVVKDFAAAHSDLQRDALWDWWQSNTMTRLEAPSLVVAVGTRWHEDDLLGRFSNPEHEGDPDRWEVIELPALATSNDVLGREPGEPLISPLLEESAEGALERWEALRRSVGSYGWAALYQQSPSPAKGAVFDVGWWRFWVDPEHSDLVSRLEDGSLDPYGKTVLVDPDTDWAQGRWLDSWDMAFKGKDTSDYVVGQRWVMTGPYRYLVHQSRARRSFPSTLAHIKTWLDPLDPASPPFSAYVHERVVEDKANGSAVIDTLRTSVSGMVAVNPTESKVARARSVTPEIETGHVLLPHPAMRGYEWVTDLLDELRGFPTAAHDDQVDALTQALHRLRGRGEGRVTVPRSLPAGPSRTGGLAQRGVTRNIASLAATQRR